MKATVTLEVEFLIFSLVVQRLNAAAAVQDAPSAASTRPLNSSNTDTCSCGSCVLQPAAPAPSSQRNDSDETIKHLQVCESGSSKTHFLDIFGFFPGDPSVLGP